MSPENVVQAVLNKSVDLGAVSLPLEHRGLSIHWIGEAPCVAVLRADSPLAGQSILPMALLARQTLITMVNPYRFRRSIDKAFLKAGGETPQMLDTNTSLIAMQMARADLGIALVDPFTANGVPLRGGGTADRLRYSVLFRFDICLRHPLIRDYPVADQ
jgi:DNA-binding transcriptional LysR family regulator